MKSNAKLVDGYKSVVDNGRTHAIVTDLPEAQEGNDLGATALEVSLMSFAGCISTIYKLIANKMQLSLQSLEVEMEGTKGSETIETVNFKVYVQSEAAEDKLLKCLSSTMNACPVGVLFNKAGVDVKGHVVKL